MPRAARRAGVRMPLRAHLAEFRKRVLLTAAGLVLGAVAGWVAYDAVFQALMKPLLDVGAVRESTVTLNFSGVASSFDMKIRVSLFLGVLVSSPWWLYQLWAFVTPGLTRKERLNAIGFLTAAVPLFLMGAGLAWWALPNAVNLLTEFTPAHAANLIDAQSYLTFVMQLVLAFGLAFLTPVVMVALNLVGIVTARTWVHGWRAAVLCAFAFAAVMTPTPDAVTMVAVAVPVCCLYFGAVAVCLWHDRRVDRVLVAQGLPRLDGTVPTERRTTPDEETAEGPVEPTAAEHASS